MTKSVLLVDDDPAALDEMAEALGDEATPFLLARNAVEARRLPRAHRTQLTLRYSNPPGLAEPGGGPGRPRQSSVGGRA